MKPETIIDRESHCRDWRALADEARDALVDALQRCPATGGHFTLLVETSEQLLPPDATNADLLKLSAWLKRHSVKHAFLSLRGRQAHRLLVQSVPAVSQPPPRKRITTQAGAKTPRALPSTHRSQAMQATLKSTPAKKRSLWERLFPRREEWDDDPTATEHDTMQSGLGIETAPALERGSWLESANRALTEATGSFIREYVEPLHSLNPGVVFSVRSVCVGMGEDAAPCLEAWEKLPPQVRNGAAKILMEMAQGAGEQLVFNQFYGLSFDLDAKLLDGQTVRTLVAFNGRRVQLRFRFDGDYLEQDARLANAPKKPAPQTIAKRATTPLSLVPVDEEGGSATDLPTDKPAKNDTPKAETPLVAAKPAPSVNLQKFINKGETILIGRRRKAIARLHIQPYGGAEIVAEICEGDLPFVIGRDPGASGHNIAPDEAPSGTGGACSRQHLVLESYDAHNGQLHVRNPAHSRNGTYDAKGHSLPERFLWRGGERLGLGGNGEGSVRIRLEAVS